MKTAGIIFPNQLFEDHPVLAENPDEFFLIEDSLFFGDAQYPANFHKQKLAYHRSTIQHFALMLEDQDLQVSVETWRQPESALPDLFKRLAKQKFNRVVCCDVIDYSLSKRIVSAATNAKLELVTLDSPGFHNTTAENVEWRSKRKKWAMVDFYRWQRTRTGILMDEDKPAGGQWSFDEDNRKKFPKKNLAQIPALPIVSDTKITKSAVTSVNKQFKNNPGNLIAVQYPVTHKEASEWLTQFCVERLELFGPYEDAIVEDQNSLYHSVLTPMLNVGLLTPRQVIEAALKACDSQQIPINSIEGFIRQILGWREFMRASYEDIGVQMRIDNHWEHHRNMPQAFYDGSTGILPVDNVIERLHETGYCHHIERLMVLGGFMFLCEIKPDDVYTWFMEMFIDSYDWVMVPNAYAMSQNADGGLITTKPYFSGSNYIIKMSHYKKGEWSEIWDALFWRWIFKNQEKLAGNFRWSMMCKNAERMSEDKKSHHLDIAESYLSGLK